MPQQHTTIMDTREAQDSTATITVTGAATGHAIVSWYTVEMGTVTAP